MTKAEKEKLAKEFAKLPEPVRKTLDQWSMSFKKLAENKPLTKSERELLCLYTAGGVQNMLTAKHNKLGTFNVTCKLTGKGDFSIVTNYKKPKGSNHHA